MYRHIYITYEGNCEFGQPGHLQGWLESITFERAGHEWPSPKWPSPEWPGPERPW